MIDGRRRAPVFASWQRDEPHARVEVHITISPTHLAFTVCDDGAGFDPQAIAESGHGLPNLRRRAERIKGT